MTESPDLKRTQVGKELEKRATVIVTTMKSNLWEPSPRGDLLRELALDLEELEAVRRIHAHLEQDLLKAECAVGTLLGARPISDELKLHVQLLRLGTERRKLLMSKKERESDVLRRLATSLSRYSHLGLEDES